MAERWAPQPMRVMRWGPTDPPQWLGINELGDAEQFDRWESAMAWVFGNWDLCECCEQYVPWHPDHAVCRACGARWSNDSSVYMATVAHLTNALLNTRFPWGHPGREEVLGNYQADAQDVIALLPHLLPLDVREALFGDLGEEN